MARTPKGGRSPSKAYWCVPETEIVLPPAPPEQVNLARMTPARKRKAWEHLKQNHPDTAALITDPDFKDLAAAFDGQVLVDVDLVKGV